MLSRRLTGYGGVEGATPWYPRLRLDLGEAWHMNNPTGAYNDNDGIQIVRTPSCWEELGGDRCWN